LIDQLTYNRVDPFAGIIYDVQRSILPLFFTKICSTDDTDDTSEKYSKSNRNKAHCD